MWAIVTFRRSDGQALSRQCIDALPTAADGTPLVAQGPVIDVVEVARRVPWPATEVQLNPHVFSLVNLDTWTWHDPGAATELVVPVTVPDQATGSDITLTVTARLVGWCHRFEQTDAVPRFRPEAVQCPGSSWSTDVGTDDQQRGAHTHQYLEPGRYQVTVEQRWTGTAAYAGPQPRTWDLGEVTLAYQREYEVRELVGVLTG